MTELENIKIIKLLTILAENKYFVPSFPHVKFTFS